MAFRLDRRATLAVVLAAPLAALSCTAPSDAELGEVDVASLSPVELGEHLFRNELFDGNGRTCQTCHILEDFGTMTPEHIEARWQADPNDPLFRSIDSDDGVGNEYTRLRAHATVRVPMPLPVHPEVGLAIRRCEAPADTMVWLPRGNPSVFNIAAERHLMVDGRDGGDLAFQANNAVNTHAEPGRAPTADELAAIAEFQKSLFSHRGVQAFIESAAELGLPEGTTEAEIRGRAFFEPNRECGICHAGALLNETSEFHPDGPGMRFETARVGINPDNPTPKHEWCWVDGDTNEIVEGPNGSTRLHELPTSDPGVALLPGTFVFPAHGGDPEEPVPNALLAAFIGSWFKIPTLWGTPNTAPYFHDNSAKDLEAMLDHYNFIFEDLPPQFEVPCQGVTDCLSEQDRADIIAFMQLLAFEPPASAATPGEGGVGGR